MTEPPDDGGTPESRWAEAESLVNGPKSEAYGDPVEFFDRLSAKVGMPAWQCCRFMVMFKATRLERRWTHNDDVDLKGYALIFLRIIERDSHLQKDSQ